MSLLTRTFWFFTPYTDADEYAVGRFFKGLSEHKHHTTTRSRLDTLLQRDIAVINLWTEYRYKGYKNLRKSKRKQLYANTQLIADDFHRFYTGHAQPAEAVLSRMHALRPQAVADPQKAVLLQALMDYFSPARGLYVYRASSSFGRLLRNPSQEKLVGDCNQIVTLYIYLYSRYFSVRDLQVRVLPSHVALHYGGIDIETTSGSFKDYGREEGNQLLAIEEIVSINLLDVSDSYIAKHEVAAEDFLQASRLAFILSHDRDVARHNLSVAYTRLTNALMKRNSFKQALKLAKASQDRALLGIVGHNGAVHEMKQHNYKAARRYAQHAPESKDLTRSIWHADAIHHYQAHRYPDAIKAFGEIGDIASVRRCYEALFFAEQTKLGSGMTTATIRQYAGTIKRMRDYAKKSGNKQMIKHADELNRYL